MGVSPIAILCNGPSLLDHHKAGNLSRLPCQTIGVNRSWEVLTSSHHVMIDPAQWEAYKRITGNPASVLPNLHTGQTGPEGAIKLNVMDTVEPRFSFQPYELGVWLCGTVTWPALQLAVHLGGNPIYFLGLDLQPRDGRGKFWGGQWPHIAEARQREIYGYARGLLGTCGIELINVVYNERDTKCHAFPKRTFDECFGTKEDHDAATAAGEAVNTVGISEVAKKHKLLADRLAGEQGMPLGIALVLEGIHQLAQLRMTPSALRDLTEKAIAIYGGSTLAMPTAEEIAKVLGPMTEDK